MSIGTGRPVRRRPRSSKSAALAALCFGALLAGIAVFFGLAMFWTSRETQATSYAITVA